MEAPTHSSSKTNRNDMGYNFLHTLLPIVDHRKNSCQPAFFKRLTEKKRLTGNSKRQGKFGLNKTIQFIRGEGLL